MPDFTVRGPYRVAVDQLAAGRVVSVDEFWASADQLKSIMRNKGVYVFAIKPPKTKSYTPCYVGKASKTFEKEAFTERNQLKYNRTLARYRSGFPVMFFVLHPPGQGKTNKKHIGEIEDFLIARGFNVNKEIENDRGTKQPQ